MIRTFTPENVPRRIDWRVRIPNQVSIRLIQEDPTGVEWKVDVGGEVVQDDVDLLARVRFHRLLREDQEVLAVPDRLALADDLSGADVECGEQVRGAVPDVVVRACLSGREGDGQHRLGPVQRLDLRLLVDGQHDHAARGEAEADGIGDLVRERGVLRNLEGAIAVLEIFLAPDPRNVVPGHGDVLGPLQIRRQLACGPVRKTGDGRRRHARQRDHPSPNLRAGTCSLAPPGRSPSRPAGPCSA
ncbi:hypothetical protein OG734_47155 [Streptomyces sp. NBC_00576]|nr:hypothetical protein [Streptomyces sp. NBC_00576]WUB68686.1 hypothetical protein OG734_00395 [Streptomyces sp. NBC_00576]WUB77010.1 hypothetical protein OG734_47155 [Streptomyces sp. NBC_00576]